jgi:membrane-associated protease RseP (regulator of RpoE activity)
MSEQERFLQDFNNYRYREQIPLRRKQKRSILPQIVLFLITLLTTLTAGAIQKGGSLPELIDNMPTSFTIPNIYIFFNSLLLFLSKGIPFSFTLLFILLAHEFGHYFMSRRHQVEATLPYFIPAPNLLGTFGAFIKMRSYVKDRRALLDIGAAGPLAGVILSIPAVIIGIKLSEVKLIENIPGQLTLGSSLLFSLLTKICVGNIPENYDILLHPICFAGWIGLFVTSLNLLPIGQLDGGHIAYAVFGERQLKISKIVFLFLLFFGLLSWFGLGWFGWFILALLLSIIGFKHPPPRDPTISLDRGRRVVGGVTLIVFFLTFIPVPFKLT